jgi:CBS domain-containing protein
MDSARFLVRNATMHASIGDQILIRTGSLDRPSRHGVVREVLGDRDCEHFLVDWDDGHESLLYPGPDTQVIPAQVSREPAPPRQLVPRLQDPVEEIMSAPVITVDEHDSLRVAAVTLADAEIGALVVLSGNTPLGIISERDVVHALAAGGDPDEVWAADVIGVRTVWAAPTDAIHHVAELMRDADIRHVPVRVQDKVVGVVSIRDVHKVLLG